jgi:hypothetical protein
MFAFTWNGTPSSNNTVSGCTLEGNDVPAGSNNYANYAGPVGGYSMLLAIVGNGNFLNHNYNIQNNIFKDAVGDAVITYTNCGTSNAGGVECNGINPGLSTPEHVWIVGNTFSHCVQPGVHINGGQNIYVANNTLTDCNINQEEDPGTQQEIRGLYIYHNTQSSSSFGQLDTNPSVYPPGIPVGGFETCLGNNTISGNGSGCWIIQNTLSGCTSTGNCINLFIGAPNVQVSGNSTGNFYGNILQNGATNNVGNGASGQGANQLTVPYCNGGTCSTTGWLNVPPTPN